jgi:hypothetical protein
LRHVRYHTGENDMSEQPENQAEEDGPRTGTCLDGPLKGQELTTRFPKGALLVDRVAGHVWIYDWTADGFRSRSGADPLPLIEDETAENNRWRAADEHDYDVVAAPWIGNADEVDAYEGDDQAGDEDDGDEEPAEEPAGPESGEGR